MGTQLLEVHYSRAYCEYVRSSIFIPFSLFIPKAHAFTKTRECTRKTRADILLNGRALPLPQSMEYHICLFTPRFLSLNSINIYIAAEGVGSPSCSGGKLGLDENELQSSLPRHRLVCLYLHYPAIPQLPLPPSWCVFCLLFFSVHITICSSSPLMRLFMLLSLSKVN